MKPKPPGYNVTHPEKDYERKRAYYEKNREKLLAAAKEWRSHNKERVAEAQKDYRKLNPHVDTRAYRDSIERITYKYVRGSFTKAKGKKLERPIRRAFVEWLKEAPCLDCGGFFHFSAMDFDHHQPNKAADVSHLARAAQTDDELWDEIMKCELVCACCHRVRHFVRRYNQRYGRFLGDKAPRARSTRKKDAGYKENEL